MKNKTVIDLFTGFLGAGKTTFISGYGSWLKQKGINFKVIENEFGIAGVDTNLLENECFEVSEITGGCICCTMKSGFADTIIKHSAECDRIIVEPSGIFSLDDYFEVVNSAVIKQCCEVGAVVTIVDPFIIDKLSNEGLDVFLSQLHSTGRIVVSKTANLGDEEIAKTRDWLFGIMNTYSKYEDDFIISKNWAEFDEVDYQIISSSLPHMNSHERVKVDHQKIFSSATFYPDKVFSQENALNVMNIIMSGQCGEVIRIKGCIRSLVGTLNVNCTPSSITIEEMQANSSPVLNIIGTGLVRKKIKELLMY